MFKKTELLKLFLFHFIINFRANCYENLLDDTLEQVHFLYYTPLGPLLHPPFQTVVGEFLLHNV
jgi:hypothetical protein